MSRMMGARPESLPASVQRGTQVDVALEVTEASTGGPLVASVLEPPGGGWPDAPHRVLRSCVEAARRAPDEVIGANDDYFDPSHGSPVRRWEVLTPTVRATGNIAAMPMWAGASVNCVTRRQSAADIVRELMYEGGS